jgi:tripartite ATP-independent transporter DctP family solute receptor
VDIASSSTSFAAQSFPRIGVGYYPYTFRDAAHLLKFADSEVFSELAEGYRKKTGVQIVSMTYYGTRHSTSNKPFRSCDEMKGLKMRVPDAPAYTALPRACGANPTPIAFAEVYLALQNGTVDAQENPLPTIDAKKFYEVQKFIVLTGHITDALLTIVAGGTWNKLSDADKQIFEATLMEGAARATAEIVEIEKKMSAEFEKRGKTVARVNRKPFRDAVIKMHNGPDATWPKDVYDKLQKL